MSEANWLCLISLSFPLFRTICKAEFYEICYHPANEHRNEKKSCDFNNCPYAYTSKIVDSRVKEDKAKMKLLKSNDVLIKNGEYRDISTYLFDSLKLIGMQPQEKHLDKWDNTVRLMIEQDKRTKEQIKQLIDECRNHKASNGFTWSTNIRSMQTLRDRWNENKIWIGMNGANKLV